jgi:hypothetical protein
LTRQWVSEFPPDFPPADMRGAVLDAATDLSGMALATRDPSGWRRAGPYLAEVRWGGANLIVVDWQPVAVLADERAARAARDGTGKRKDRRTRIAEYSAAGRAYRLLSVALRAEGISADATRLHFRAEVMDRKAFFHRRALGRWLFSWLLGTFAGYGDQLWRLLITYAAVVGAFASVIVGVLALYGHQPISFEVAQDAIAFSAISFHGLGLQPAGLVPAGGHYVALDDALAHVAAVEAAIGLSIEALLVAAFTRRVTGS